MDLIAADAYPPTRSMPIPNTTAFQQFLAGTGSALCLVGRRRLQRHAPPTPRSSATSSASRSTPAPTRSTIPRPAPGKTPEGPNFAPNMAYLGWGIYVTSRVSGDEKKRKAAWSAAAHLGGKDSRLWTSAYPSGFQPYRNSHFNYDEWATAGYDQRLHRGLSRLQRRQLQPPERRDRAAHPRHLPVLLGRRGRTGQGLCRPVQVGAGDGGRDRRRLGEDHRPDRSREPDQALQGFARHVTKRGARLPARTLLGFAGPARRACSV